MVLCSVSQGVDCFPFGAISFDLQAEVDVLFDVVQVEAAVCKHQEEQTPSADGRPVCVRLHPRELLNIGGAHGASAEASRPAAVMELMLHEAKQAGTGGHLWAASLHLAAWLFSRHKALTGRRVIELACGQGLPALVAAKCGAAEVLATDMIPEVLQIFRQNAAGNALPAVGKVLRAAPLDFATSSGLRNVGVGVWDLVLFSDCVYISGVGRAMVHAVLALLQQETGLAVGVLPAAGVRPGLDEFFAALKSEPGLQAMVRPVEGESPLQLQLVVMWKTAASRSSLAQVAAECEEKFDVGSHGEWEELGDLFTDTPQSTPRKEGANIPSFLHQDHRDNSVP